MQILLEKQETAEPIDAATKAALEVARAEARRGEVVTLEQSKILVRKQYQAWRKTQEVLTV